MFTEELHTQLMKPSANCGQSWQLRQWKPWHKKTLYKELLRQFGHQGCMIKWVSTLH